MSTTPNPIDLRDLVIDEPNGFVVADTLEGLVARGWPAEAILAELPGVSDAEIRRAIDRVKAAA